MRILGKTDGVSLTNNTIRNTRTGAEPRQTAGVHIGPDVGAVQIRDNGIDAPAPLKDERQ